MVSTMQETTLVPAGSGQAVSVQGTVITFKAVGGDTGDAFAVWEAAVPPGCGPAPHVHHGQQETVYVLQGRFEFFRPEAPPLPAGPGDCVRTPRGVPHAFTNVGDEPGRLLVVGAPAGAERFFAAIGQTVEPGAAPAPAPGPRTPEQIATLARTAREFDTEFLVRPGPDR